MEDDGSTYKVVDENEPTSYLGEWIGGELKPHGDASSSAGIKGMKETEMSLPCENANDIRNNDGNVEVICQRTTYKPDFLSGFCQTSMSTGPSSGLATDMVVSQSFIQQSFPVHSDNYNDLLRRGMLPTNSPVGKGELCKSPSLQQTAPDLQPMQKVQQSVAQPSLIHSNIYYQKQQQPVQLAQLQSPQQYMSTTMHDTWQMQKLNNPSILQLKPESGPANSLLETSARQLDTSATNRQKFESQNNALELQRQQKITLGSDSSKMSESMTSQQMRPSMQLHKQLNTQNFANKLPHGIQPKIHTSHPQGLVIGDQQKPMQMGQGRAHEASPASSKSMTQKAVPPNPAEWHDHAYHQLLTMKELYLPEVIKIYNRAQELGVQPPNAESAIKYEKTRLFAEKIIKFLHMRKADLVCFPKDRVYQQMNSITNYIYQFRSKTPVPSQPNQPTPHLLGLPQNRNFHSNIANAGTAPAVTGPTQFITGPGRAISHPSPSFMSQRSSLPSRERVDLSVVDPLQRNLVRSTQQYAFSRSQQPTQQLPNNMSKSLLEKSASGLLQHCSIGIGHHNSLSTAQRASSSPRNIAGSFGSSMGASPVNSSVIHSQNNLFMQAQKMHQPINQPLMDQNKQHMMVLRMGENNDLKFGQSMSFGPRMVQQHLQTGLRADHSPQSMLSSSSCQPHAASSQSPRYSSPQDLPTRVSRGAVPLLSTSSPFVIPSPLTPQTPSSSQVDHERKSSCHSPSSHAQKDSGVTISLSEGAHQVPYDNNCYATDILEVPKLSADKESEEPAAERDPFKHLLKVVDSSSREALSASVKDIGAITSLIDRRAGTVISGDSRDIIGEDCADDIRCFLQDKDLFSVEREESRSPSLASESFQCSHGEGNSESAEISQSKRLKTEAKEWLKREIKDISRQLVETSVEMVILDRTDFSRYGADAAAIVRCSYIAVGQFAKSHVGFPGLSLRLLVNNDYPYSSPIILETPSQDFCETEEVEVITQKAMSKFNMSLRKYSLPITVRLMVKTWDSCARKVYHEYAKTSGGECFTSKYGGWDDCVIAV